MFIAMESQMDVCGIVTTARPTKIVKSIPHRVPSILMVVNLRVLLHQVDGELMLARFLEKKVARQSESSQTNLCQSSVYGH